MIISDHLGTDVSAFRFVLVPLRRFAELQSCALLKFFRGDLTNIFRSRFLAKKFLQVATYSQIMTRLEDKS